MSATGLPRLLADVRTAHAGIPAHRARPIPIASSIRMPADGSASRPRTCSKRPSCAKARTQSRRSSPSRCRAPAASSSRRRTTSPRIREICDRYDVLLIADEVITGFGRTGRWFGLEHYGVEPDIMQFAKGITSGYIPLGGIGVSDDIARRHQQCAAGKALDACLHLLGPSDVLRRGAEEHRDPRARTPGDARGRAGHRLLDGLRSLESLDGVGHVRGLGLMAACRGGRRQGQQELFSRRSRASVSGSPTRCSNAACARASRWTASVCTAADDRRRENRRDRRDHSRCGACRRRRRAIGIAATPAPGASAAS